MNLLLIKVGKAFKTLQRDGLLKGGKRIFASFFALFGKVGSGDILFITGGVGDSARYRCHHVAEELRRQDFLCSVTVQDNPLLPTYGEKFSVFVFHRTLFTPNVKKLIENIKAQDKEIIFETDDLVYDPKYLEFMDYFKKMNAFEKKLYENGVGGEILADPFVKTCTTTTTFLAEKLKEEGKQVIIVPNRLSLKDIEFADEAFKKRSETKEDEFVRIGYFSGTISHNKDFASIAVPLTHLFLKYPNVKLVLAGPLDLPEELNFLGKQLERLEFADRKKHFANISKIDINLAPLEKDNPFCESKSELKFFEAGVVNVPTVATATQTFKEAITDGVDGFVAENEQEWIEKLEKLIVDQKLRRNMGARAWETTMHKYTTKNANNEEYYEFLRSKVNK